MKCKICSSVAKKIFITKILNKYDATYYHCIQCGFLQTEKPFWLEEAYRKPINISDTGLLSRNLFLAEKTAVLLYFLFNLPGKFLDYGGGYGILTRLMRDFGFDFYWHDPHVQNLFSKHFEYQENIGNIELITSFESFEHFSDPLIEIEKIINISSNIFFSTIILPSPVPAPEKWWYYAFEHGQHIAFYSVETLQFIAKKFSLNFHTNRSNLHLFTKKEIDDKYFNRLLRKSERLIRRVKKKLQSKTTDDMNYVKSLFLENKNENTI